MDTTGTVPDSLDGLRLASALRAGIYRLISREDLINKINVFPVPDGDTGTNLALTLHSVLVSLHLNPESHAGQLLTRVADAALDGARGNSGAILAQFFLGLGDRAGPLPALSAAEFAEALGTGASYAREAMAQPREGTILTVLDAVAAEAAGLAGAGDGLGLRRLFETTLLAARKSLAGTTAQLEALRRANVVDAGALGFVEMLEGMTRYLETGEGADEAPPAPVPAPEEATTTAGEVEDLAHRWCTECMVTGEDIDRRKLREELSTLGASLVIAGTQRKVKLHLHLNEPQRLFEVAARHGAVSGQKADDMQAQQDAAHHEPRRRVAIVVDSAADIPDSLLEKLDIHMVPVRVHFGAQSYLDKVSLSPEQFFRELESNPLHPKTSQPPPGDFRRAYEFLGSHYESVVYVGLSARLSGTFQSGASAAARLQGRDKVHAIDSGSASLGQGLVAIRAAEVAHAGEDLDAVRLAISEARGQTRTWACLATLDYAVRGGRVPAWVGTLARLLRLSPLLAVRPDGRVGLGGVLFGRGDLYRKFARFLRRRMPAGRNWRIAIAHANAAEGAHVIAAALAEGGRDMELLPVIPLGTALGVHGGPGCVVVALQSLDPARGRPQA